MSDLIDRQAAIDALNEVSEHYTEKGREWHPHVNFMTSALLDLPSVQPEIIRCKDCKHRYIEDMIWHCPFGLMGGEDFFCGYGSFGKEKRNESFNCM